MAPKKKKKNKNEEEQRLTAEEFKDVISQIDERISDRGGRLAAPPSVPAHSPEDFGDYSLTNAALVSIQEALAAEGMDATFWARKIKFLLSEKAKTPKWNKDTDSWDYFIDPAIWVKLIDMGIKVHGGYAPEQSVQINIDTNLQEILENTSRSPEEANRMVQEYFQVVAKAIGRPVEEVIEAEEVISEVIEGGD